MKKKILIVQPIHESGVRVFDDRFDVRVASDPSAATVIKEIKGVEGVVVRMAPFTREIIEAADALKVIGRHGVGVDTIDVKAATEQGIVVSTPRKRTPCRWRSTPSPPSAPWPSGSSCTTGRSRTGGWEIRNSYKAVDLDGKTLGLVGIGRIGTLVARKAAAAFNMKVIAFDPYVSAGEGAGDGRHPRPGERRRLPAGGRGLDAYPAHPGNAAIRQCGAARPDEAHRLPDQLLPGGGRGRKGALQALKTGVIAGAAIDVYDPEPPLNDNPLYELENIILSPHSAALTQECVIRMAVGAAEGVVDVLTGKRPQFVVNPEVLKK